MVRLDEDDFRAGLKKLIKERDELRAAAQAVVDRWDTPAWKDVPHTAEYISRLRAALAKGK